MFNRKISRLGHALPTVQRKFFCETKFSSNKFTEFEWIFERRPKKLSPFEKTKIKNRLRWESIQHTNQQITKRELKNDSIQLPLKYLTLFYTGENSAAFKAELIRSSIDCLNHIILYVTSAYNTKPSENFPYGTEKAKNFVVMIPGILFVAVGIDTIFESYVSLIDSSTPKAHGSSQPFSMIPLLLYFISITVEGSIIMKNVGESLLQDGEYNAKKSTILDIIKLLLSKKKDPVLQVVLFENAITLVSTIIPIICLLLEWLYPLGILEYIGSLLIGMLQIKCGIHLIKSNYATLIGKSIEKNIIDDITNVIKKNDMVKDVLNQKGMYVGANVFKFFANIQFDMVKINKLIEENLADTQERVKYINTLKSRGLHIPDLADTLMKMLLKKIHLITDELETEIRIKYPGCISVDLEIHQSNLNFWQSEWDSTRIDELKFKDLNLENAEWFNSVVDKYINLEKKIQSKSLQYSIQYRSHEVKNDDLLDYLNSTEEERFEIISNCLKEDQLRL